MNKRRKLVFSSKNILNFKETLSDRVISYRRMVKKESSRSNTRNTKFGFDSSKWIFYWRDFKQQPATVKR